MSEDKFGWTPLHSAVFFENKENVELHITNGADVNVKDNLGKTPLDYANKPGSNGNETADLLRKHGGKTGEELKAKGK